MSLRDLTPKNEETDGSTMSGALGGTKKQEDEEEVVSSETPQMGGSTAPATIGGGGTTSPSVKAIPKQQKAGTGTFANLKSYLQAAQGSNKVAKAATQRVQNVASQAQRGIQQAQQTFGSQLQAGSGAFFQGGQTEQEAARAAQEESARILGSALGTTYQAPAQPTAVEGQATPEPVQQTQQYFNPKDIETYSNIINAQYQGPQSLQQAGLYNQAARAVQTAQQALQQTQTAGGREQLLRDIFGRTRDYSRGASKLDALLLNTSKQGVRGLQQQAEQAGNIQQQLQAAENKSAADAANRAAAIQQISSGAREAFTGARTAEEAATEAYIKNIQDNWEKLPDYFKDVLTQAKAPTVTTSRVGDILPVDGYKNTYYGGKQSDINKEFDRRVGASGVGTTYNLSREEAAILGLTPGSPLYGFSPEMIAASPMARGEELITKNQLSRQLALAELANLDKSRALQKALQYSDLEKAGTKDITSSLNVPSIQKQMLEKQQEMEKDLASKLSPLNIKTGSGKYDWTPMQYSQLDLLKQGGYTPSDMAGLVPEDSAETLLRNIASGKEYVPTENASYIPSYIQKAYQEVVPRSGGTQGETGKKAIARTQETMKKYGGLDSAQVVEDEKTKARAEALRSLLGNIYKNE